MIIMRIQSRGNVTVDIALFFEKYDRITEKKFSILYFLFSFWQKKNNAP